MSARAAPLPAAGLALAASLALWPALGVRNPEMLVTAGGLGVVLYLAGVLRLWPGALPWAMGLLAAEYILSLLLRPVVLDLAAPLYALAFFTTAELGWLVQEVRRGLGPWPARLLASAGLGLSGAALGWLSLLAPALPVAGGLGLTALGVLAASATLAALVWTRFRNPS